MALIILGAGATRGCSFVKPTENPCLPPVDADFFTQLQRVHNPKHQQLITSVLNDVVSIFGRNFDVTMETVFTTLEHTIRMIEVTGETRSYKKDDLKRMRDRLRQSIAVVLEESISEKDESGRSKITPQSCSYHERLVKEVLCPNDDIISFNYDCVLDYALKNHGDGKWNPRYGYGFYLGSKGVKLTGDEHWEPAKKATKSQTIHVYKLHGSLHFLVSKDHPDNPSVGLKERPYTKQNGDLRFTIIPPEWHKAYDAGVFPRLWSSATKAIRKCEHAIFIGYSLPETDLHSTALFRTGFKHENLKSLVVVNPDRDARKRVRSTLLRAIKRETKVLSFNTLEEFVHARRDLWEV